MPAGSKVAKLEGILKQRYPNNDSAVYGTLNNMGFMRGNKVTKKGAAKASRRPRGRKATPMSVQMAHIAQG